MENQASRFQSIEVVLESPAFIVVPGGSVTVPFLIRNRTGKEDYFEVSIRGIPSTWVVVNLPVLHMSPGEERGGNLVIQPPAGMAGSTGSTAVVIHVSSQTDLAQAGEAGFDLQMRPVNFAGSNMTNEPEEPLFTSDLSPRRINAGQAARVRIHNPGNYQESFREMERNRLTKVKYPADL